MTYTDLVELEPQVIRYLRITVSRKRYAHSLRVADCAVRLCLRFGSSVEKAKIAGLAHDLGRELHAEQILELALEDGFPLNTWERRNPIFLHGRAAATILATRFNLDDPAILEAVRYHTLGEAGMGNLAKILFCSDYLEPERKHVTKEFRSQLEAVSLNEMVLRILERVRDYEKQLEKPSQELYEKLKESLSRNDTVA